MGDVIPFPARTLPLVGEECRLCLGTGQPEHFSLSQPEGRVRCQPCNGTGRIVARIQYLRPLPTQPVEITTRRPKP